MAGLDLLGSYQKGQQIGLQKRKVDTSDMDLALEAEKVAQERQKKQNFKDAVDEMRASLGDKWDELPEEYKYSIIIPAANYDGKGTMEALNAAMQYMSRKKSAPQLFADKPELQTAYREGGMPSAKQYSDITEPPGNAAPRQFGTQASDFKIVTLAIDPSGKQMGPGKGYRYQAIPDPTRPEGFRLHPLGPAEDTRTSTNIVIGQDESGNIITVPSRGEPVPKKTPMGLKPGEQLQPKVAPTVPTEQVVALQQIDTLKEALEQVTDLYDDSFVGPIAGPAGKIADDWGVMPNAKRSEFRALTANLYNTIIYLRSGKQINEEEAKRLLAELPTMNVSPVAFQAKLKKFTWELNSIERGRKRQLKGAGYRNVPGDGTAPESTPQGGSKFKIIQVK